MKLSIGYCSKLVGLSGKNSGGTGMDFHSADRFKNGIIIVVPAAGFAFDAVGSMWEIQPVLRSRFNPNSMLQ